MADFITFGRDAAADIVDAVRRVRAMPLGGSDGFDADTPHVQFRVAKTTTSEEHPNYPATGDTFVVELGEMAFTETPGDQGEDWTAYSPKDTRIAHDICGNYYVENSYVYVALHHGRWFILGGCASSSSSSSLSSSSVSSSSVPSSSSSVSSSSSSSLSSGSSSSIPSSSSSSSVSSSSSSSSSSQICQEVEVVTDVQCVNGSIVVTKKKLRLCGCDCTLELV